MITKLLRLSGVMLLLFLLLLPEQVVRADVIPLPPSPPDSPLSGGAMIGLGILVITIVVVLFVLIGRLRKKHTT